MACCPFCIIEHPALLIAGLAWVIMKYRSNRVVVFGLLFFL
jgi:hypothetical protein